MAGVGDLTDRVWLRSYEEELRSNEEEQGAIRVYRPATYSFPPSRGRDGLRFDADGGFQYLGPGGDDRPGVDDGTWRADTPDATSVTATVDDQLITFRIVELTPQILRLEWTDT